jgi:D-methionine transport system ATP-binding protein
LVLKIDRVDFTLPRATRSLLANLNLTIASGEWVAIAGATGAGKTTLLKLLNRLLEPTTGQISIDSMAYRDLDPISLRQRVMLVPQIPNLLGMTVAAALAYPLQLQQLPPAQIKERIVDITNQFKIPADWLNRTQSQLSIGQQQIVTIARGVISQPQVLLLDEPCAHLDLPTSKEILATVKSSRADPHQTTIVAIHQLALVADLIDRLVYIQAGKIPLDRAIQEIDLLEIIERIEGIEQSAIAEWE